MSLDQNDQFEPVNVEEVELGIHGEYVLSHNQIITSPDGTDYKII